MVTSPPTSRQQWQQAAQDLRRQFENTAAEAQREPEVNDATRRALLESWISAVLFYYTAIYFPDETLFDRDSLLFYEDFHTQQGFYWKHRFDAGHFRQLGFEAYRQDLYEAIKAFCLQQLPAALGYSPDYLRRPPARESWLAYCERFRQERDQPPGYYTSAPAGRAALSFVMHWSQGMVEGRPVADLLNANFGVGSPLIRLEGEAVAEPVQPPRQADTRRRVLDDFWRRAKGCLPSREQGKLEYELELLSDQQMEALRQVQIIKPTNIWLASFFLGFWGIDRLMLGRSDLWMGLVKFFTFGGLGMIWLYDVLTIVPRTRERNYENLVQELNRH